MTAHKQQIKTSKKAKARGAPKITKKAMVEQLLKSDKGATIEELAKDWLATTRVRGHLSILKKAGAKLSANGWMGSGYRITEKAPKKPAF